MIHVLATIELAPGVREQFLAEFRKIVPLVLAEQGCLEYGPTIDFPTAISAQIPLRENVATIVEKWASLADLERHLTAPHMVEYRQKVKGLVVKTTLQVLAPA